MHCRCGRFPVRLFAVNHRLSKNFNDRRLYLVFVMAMGHALNHAGSASAGPCKHGLAPTRRVQLSPSCLVAAKRSEAESLTAAVIPGGSATQCLWAARPMTLAGRRIREPLQTNSPGFEIGRSSSSNVDEPRFDCIVPCSTTVYFFFTATSRFADEPLNAEVFFLRLKSGFRAMTHASCKQNSLPSLTE